MYSLILHFSVCVGKFSLHSLQPFSFSFSISIQKLCFPIYNVTNYWVLMMWSISVIQSAPRMREGEGLLSQPRVKITMPLIDSSTVSQLSALTLATPTLPRDWRKLWKRREKIRLVSRAHTVLGWYYLYDYWADKWAFAVVQKQNWCLFVMQHICYARCWST